MSDVKKNLLKEIQAKIERKRSIREQAVTKNTIDSFVLEFISNVEDTSEAVSDKDVWLDLVGIAMQFLEARIRSIDFKSRVEVTWQDVDGRMPQVNGVTVKWSKTYQNKCNCEEQLFVDATSVLFK